MKKIRTKTGCIVAFVAVAIAIVTGVRSCLHPLTSGSGFSLTQQSHTDATHAVLNHIKQLGEWEFLSIYDEVLIDTTRSRFLAQDDELVRIYHGTLRLGIDMDECTQEWVTSEGDSLLFHLPPIQLLDQNFIDEARTRSFYQHGEWNSQTREDLYLRARHTMMQRCITPENLKKAEENAIQQIKALLRTLGYTKVKVVIN